MPGDRRKLTRVQQLNELLDIEYDKLHSLERDLALQPPGPTKTALEQNIKRENWPTIHKLEKELAGLLAEVAEAEQVPTAEAEVVCAELVEEVRALESTRQDDWPDKVLQQLSDLKQKLDEPGQAAAAKLKVALPIIPLLVSYELELDTESTLVQIGRKIKSLFSKAVPENPR